MHLLAEESADILCPLDKAYEYACNLEKFGQWFPGVIRIVADDAHDFTSTEKSYLETVSIPLRGKAVVRIRVKEAKRYDHFVTEGTLRPLLPRMEIRFLAVGPTSTRINWKMYSRTRSAFIGVVLVPWARHIMRGRAKVGIAKLKSILEAQ